MRADAQRNRTLLLNAAIALVLEVGGEPSRDAIAARAAVGIGTLYRHFPDQPSLLNAVVRHALERSIEAGEAALADTPCGVEALRQYMHAAIDSGIGAVNLLYPLLDRPHPELRERAESLIHALIARVQRETRHDVSPADIVFATLRFGRPLAVGLSADEERAIAHRQLDMYMDGLLNTQGAPRSAP